MSNSSAATRWWENYLVRYFLPSVAGMFIVRWLDVSTCLSVNMCLDVNKCLLIGKYFPEVSATEDGKFGSSNLIAWLLFGSLYCYIASYPVLVFHATRVLDFQNRKFNLRYGLLIPHAVVIYFLVVSWTGVFIFNRSISFLNGCYFVGFAIIFFVGFQLCRLRRASFVGRDEGHETSLANFFIKWFKFCSRKEKGRQISLAYAYLYKLSKKRVSEGVNGDIVESYKHLREHGNTALILILEIALCPIFWFLLKMEGYFSLVNFSLISVFVVLWSFPAALVYFFGQHLERNFSSFSQ